MGRFFRIVGLALLSVVLLIAIGVGGLVAYSAMQPKSFDECMLAEMRGQDQAVVENVRAVCQSRFNVMLEVDVPAGQWSWSTTDDGWVEFITLSPFSSTYRLSRVQVRVSPKECAASLPADWSAPFTLWASTDYVARSLYSGPSTCMRIEQAFVYRR